jgi:hypothetical protein
MSSYDFGAPVAIRQIRGEPFPILFERLGQMVENILGRHTVFTLFFRRKIPREAMEKHTFQNGFPNIQAKSQHGGNNPG